MPELPEVETIRRDLEKKLLGQTLSGVDIRLSKIFQGKSADVVGAKVIGIWRRAKLLGVDFDNGRTLLFHLKLTGQLVLAFGAGGEITFSRPIPFAGMELPAKTTHAVFHFDGSRLFFNDLRQFGWIRVVDSSQKEAISEQMGVEPLSGEFTAGALEEIVSKTKRPIKLVLVDQEKIAGIGNIYANDALFEAGIHPQRPAKGLSAEEVKRLRDAVVLVLNEGLKYGGSSAADESYVRPTGEPGGYQKHFRVYQRVGQLCPRCGAVIKRVNIGGRGTFFCPRCQK